MPKSTSGFSSTFDPDGLLRMMYGCSPVMPSSTLGGSDYARAQFAVNLPPIALGGTSRRPGLDTAIAALNAPLSLATSLMAMDPDVPTSDLAQSRPQQMDPQAALLLGAPEPLL